MMIVKRALLAVAFTAATVAVTATPAQAFPIGDHLMVYAYYADSTKTEVIGQYWIGCGQRSGSWGNTSYHRSTFFTPC